MEDDKYYTIEIFTEDNQPSLLDEIKSLSSAKQSKEEPEPILITKVEKKAKNNGEPKKKKKKKSLLLEAFDMDEDDEKRHDQEIDEDTLLDVDAILMREAEEDEDGNIIDEQRRGYKKLKKGDNEYKKEFAEELTLLYSLLDETSKFGKDLEKDLSNLRGSKTRGISKYTNDLAELVLTSKQNKLNILKEISSLKKTIADLKIKSEGKDKNKNGGNSPEQLASMYFKNILNHGRNNFINALNNNQQEYEFVDDEYDSVIDSLESVDKRMLMNPADDEDEKYNRLISDRLENNGNPFRSEEASKYIEYENRGVKLYVKKCIDTGDWEFVAIDKNRQQIYDYPLPSKRDAGRMKFSDDGTYATDAKGRIYNVIEYYLPNDDDY